MTTNHHTPSQQTSSDLATNDNQTISLLFDVSKLIFNEKIAQGSYGLIWSGKYYNEEVVIKCFSDYSIFANEAKMMELLCKDLGPRYIVNLLGYGSLPSEISKKIKDSCFEPNIIIMEKMDTYNNQNFTWNTKIKMLAKIAFILKMMHAKGFVHGDIKLSNVLLKDGNIKLCDFSTTKHEKINNAYISNFNGFYLAPEVIRCEEMTKKSDIYSFGMMLVETLFENSEEHLFLQEVGYGFVFRAASNPILMEAKINKFLQEKKDVPLAFTNLLKNCLAFNPKDRPTTDEIVEQLNLPEMLLSDKNTILENTPQLIPQLTIWSECISSTAEKIDERIQEIKNHF